MMKNVFSALLFLLTNFAYGQIEWVGNHIFSDSTADILRTSQGHWVLLHSNGAGFSVFDATGSKVFESFAAIFEGEGASGMVELQDSSLMYVTGGIACDVLVGYFIRYDKNWNEMATGNTNGSSIIAKFNDNSIAIADQFEGGLTKITDNGTRLWSVNVPWNWAKDMVVNTADELLVATINGLIRISPSGSFIDTLPNLILDRIEILPNGSYLAQQGDVLQLYDADFAPMAFFQQQGDAIQDVSFTQDEIAVLTSAPSVVRLDFGLTPIGTMSLSDHNQTFTSVAFADDGFIVGGGEQYGNNGHENQSAFIKDFRNDGSTAQTNADVALVQVSQSSPIQVQNFNWYYKATVPNISVTVKNNGPSVINSLTVNFSFPYDNIFIWECALVQSFSKSFENLNLQPNASMQLTWGDQEVWFSSNPTGEQLELCMWTSLPNLHLETNNDNDVSCTEVLVAAPTSHCPSPSTTPLTPC
ncbi:MAG: hypothetical protein IPN76_03620 [Saprospiraceae bacterium]|nr:hypothetical protein [Saprospiraceae bacterium]